jgi:hypothetical protein
MIKQKTTKEKLEITINRLKLLEEQFTYLRVLFDRLEDRVTALEDRVLDENEVVFEADWDPDAGGENSQ